MTREEILFEIEFYKSAIKASGNHTVFLKEKLQDYEKQLAELEVEVYEPTYMPNVSYSQSALIKVLSAKEITYANRHNAGEELKKLISEENAKQGWKVDWENHKQPKCFMYYDNVREKVSLDYHNTDQHYESELYFSEQSSKDQEFLDKIKPLWKLWKGIE